MRFATRTQGGFVWPANDETGATAILRHAGHHFPKALRYGKGRNLVVQAGGNVGVYPKRLAQHFKRVLTFEPDPANFACLEQNLAGVKNVEARQCALGESAGTIGLNRHPVNVGAYRAIPEGDLPVITLDSLQLTVCDLIWFDIEGSELAALKGGEDTIKRLRPVVILEDMGIGGPEGEVRNWLKRRGYKEVAKLFNDYVLVP